MAERTYLEKRIDKVNFVVDFFEDPCQAPWTVYIETAMVPFGNLVLALLAFGMDDVIRGYFRPKGLYGARRFRRLGPKWRRHARIPELGEMIGSKLPGAEIAQGRKVSQGVRTLWLIDGALQRVMFWWMVIDLSIEFFYEWGTALNKTEYCASTRAGSAAREGADQTLNLPDGYGALSFETCLKEWGEVECSPPNGLFANRSGGKMVWGCHVENTHPVQWAHIAGGLRGPGDVYGDWLGEYLVLPPGGAGDITVSIPVHTAGGYVTYFHATGAGPYPMQLKFTNKMFVGDVA